MSSSASNKKPHKRKYQNVPGQESHGALADNDDPLAFPSNGDTNTSADAPEPAVCRAEFTVELDVDDAIDRLGMGIFQYRILIAAGLCFAADAMEVLLLSFLSIILQDEWGLTDDETAFITSILFAGALVGTSVLGPLADKWGRRPVFILAATMIALFGIATSLAQNYEMILAIMFVIGFGVGGLTVPFDTLAEFLPAQGRGTNLLLIEYFWTVGCLLVIVFAELTLAHGKANWRLFVILCSLPCFVSIFLGYLFVPESVRWLVSMGRNAEALDILRGAARMNGVTVSTPLTQGGEAAATTTHSDDADDNSHHDEIDMLFPLNTQLTSEEDHSAEYSASCLDLLKPQWRGTILRLWGAWGGFGLGYYGAILSVTKVFDSEETTIINATLDAMSNTTIAEVSEDKNNFDYSAIFISSSAELLGTTLVIILVDRVGRIPSQVVGYSAAGACIFLLCFLASAGSTDDTAANDRWELVLFGFILRALDMAATCTSWVMTAEVLSTEIRSTGHSSANAMARLGAFFSPFLVDTLSLQSLGIVMLIVHWFTALCVCQLPETKGAHMGGGGGGGGGGESEQVLNTESNDIHDQAEEERPVQNEEPDGLFVIDSDDEEDYNSDIRVNGDGAHIHVLHDYKERIESSLELS